MKEEKLLTPEFDQHLLFIGDHKQDYGTWEQIGQELNQTYDCNHSESFYRKRYHKLKETEFEQSGYMNQAWRSAMERKKLQTEKLELNRWITEQSRYEQILERITDSIDHLTPLSIPEDLDAMEDQSQRAAVLCISDCHYGVEFTIYDLNNKVINSYSPEIFEKRMWTVFNRVLSIIKKEKFTKLYIFSLGDDIDGLLRVGQLAKLRYGVIESTIRYAYFMANWLNELSKHVAIEFHITHGNHSELRLLGQPKYTFQKENMGFVISVFLQLMLDKNPNFKLITNQTGLIYAEIVGLNILGIHGEVKDLATALNEYSTFYNKNLDIVIGGHLHHEATKNVGINKDVIRVPGLIGVEDFSARLIRNSNPGCSLLVLEQGKGRTINYFIKVK